MPVAACCNSVNTRHNTWICCAVQHARLGAAVAAQGSEWSRRGGQRCIGSFASIRCFVCSLPLRSCSDCTDKVLCEGSILLLSQQKARQR